MKAKLISVHSSLTLALAFPEILQLTSHKWITEQPNVLEIALQCVRTQRLILWNGCLNIGFVIVTESSPLAREPSIASVSEM